MINNYVYKVYRTKFIQTAYPKKIFNRNLCLNDIHFNPRFNIIQVIHLSKFAFGLAYGHLVRAQRELIIIFVIEDGNS